MVAFTSPKDFLRSRRPERFSDSTGIGAPSLDRAQLEYHLETLTSRSEEGPFERFARRLLERTICPNLLPHTGPTGGGDSKVDSETYPVSEQLALGWFVGSGDLAAKERWAFAFSAKREWQPKLASDVEKLVKTGRGYVRCFFVTNQFVSDKNRAKAEDRLRKKHTIDVRILDRTWILDRVFNDRLEAIAAEELSLEGSMRRVVRKGPLDTAREQDLAELEQRIAAALRVGQGTPGAQVVEDCLEAAELVRSLDRPRTEVDGHAQRADRLAVQFGTVHQRTRSAYDRAWTAFWWHEDVRTFLAAYEDFVGRTKDSRNPYELELWTNLHQLARGAAHRDEFEKIGATEPDVAPLHAALGRVAQDAANRSASLHARTLRLLLKLSFLSPDTGVERLDELLRELEAALAEGAPLIGYPFKSVAQVVVESAEFFGHRPAYDQLFELVMRVVAKRDGEISGARLLLARGAQQLEQSRPYEAVRCLGRALHDLHKDESRDELVRALYLLASCYDRIGLLWASRGSLLAAASYSMSTFWTHDQVTRQQALTCHQVKWSELRLGRLPHLLAWHELDVAIRGALVGHWRSIDHLAEQDFAFDLSLAALILRSPLDDLRALTALPDTLSRLGLTASASSLLYALGHEESLDAEFVAAARITPSDADAVRTFFELIADRVEGAPSTAAPLQLLNRRTVAFTTNILGCVITTDCKTGSPCIEVAESLLSALEGFLATGIVDRILAKESSAAMIVCPSDFADRYLEVVVDEESEPIRFDIRCKTFNPNSLDPEQQVVLRGELMEVVVAIADRLFFLPDSEVLIEKLIRDDVALQRALDFTSSFVVVSNILGHTPRTSMDSWTAATRSFELRRHVEWRTTAPPPPRPEPIRQNSVAANGTSSTEPGWSMPSLGATPHSAIQALSLIRIPLWAAAKWSATGFVTTSEGGPPPQLVLVFKNAEPAKRIFALWHQQLGDDDPEDRLRVAIVRGISRASPHAYRVVIGSNPPCEPAELSDGSMLTMTFRINAMEPTSGENLERFLLAFRRSKRFAISCGTLLDNDLRLVSGHAVLKACLVVRDAWEVGVNDLERVAISDDDVVVMPPVMPAVIPVNEVLHAKKNRRNQGG